MSEPATLIFDGDCGFCTTTANYIERKFAEAGRPLNITPWQFADLAKFGVTEAQVADQVYLVAGENKDGGHECFAQLLRLHGNPFYRAAAWLMLTPVIAPLSELTYRWIAKNRHKLPGGTPACKMPQN